MEVAQYLTVAVSKLFKLCPLHNLSGKTQVLFARSREDAPVALPPDLSFFENARQGTLKKPRSLPNQGAPVQKPFRVLEPGHCRCGSMSHFMTRTRPLFRSSLPIERLFGCHTETRDEPRLPCRGHRQQRMPVSINVVGST